jgi:hypothetical protein
MYVDLVKNVVCVCVYVCMYYTFITKTFKISDHNPNPIRLTRTCTYTGANWYGANGYTCEREYGQTHPTLDVIQ